MPLWPDSDETLQLLNHAGDGDAAAVNQLLERHRNSLRRAIHLRLDRALARRVDASDIVQDVLVEANARLTDYLRDPRLPFHLWLRQLAKDRIIDMHRRHRGAQRRSVDREQGMSVPGTGGRASINLAGMLPAAELTPAAAALRKELEERFLLALEQLEEDDREMILMRHVEQLGNTEVAQALDLSPAAAGMRHLRALRKLRAVLGDTPSQAGWT
jgi:RNA polymerase sigma-70 factor, ECF subfamily